MITKRAAKQEIKRLEKDIEGIVSRMQTRDTKFDENQLEKKLNQVLSLRKEWQI